MSSLFCICLPKWYHYFQCYFNFKWNDLKQQFLFSQYLTFNTISSTIMTFIFYLKTNIRDQLFSYSSQFHILSSSPHPPGSRARCRPPARWSRCSRSTVTCASCRPSSRPSPAALPCSTSRTWRSSCLAPSTWIRTYANSSEVGHALFGFIVIWTITFATDQKLVVFCWVLS